MTKRYVFHGRVQGVGFRWTTRDVARRHPVTGYVRNQRDGTVELVAEGTAAAIAALVGEIESRMSGHVDRRDETDPPEETFDTFEIRH